jgi:hypothetical protein
VTAATVALVRPHLAEAPRSTRTIIRRLAALTPAGGQLQYAVADARLMRDTGLSESAVRRARRWAVAAGLLEAVSGIGHRATRYRWRLTQPGAELTTQSVRGSGQPEHAHGSLGAPQQSMRTAVQAVRELRPDWHAPGIAWTLTRARRRGASLQRALAALLAVARAGDTRSPARVLTDGWWWDAGDPRHTAPQGPGKGAGAVPKVTALPRAMCVEHPQHRHLHCPECARRDVPAPAGWRQR